MDGISLVESRYSRKSTDLSVLPTPPIEISVVPPIARASPKAPYFSPKYVSGAITFTYLTSNAIFIDISASEYAINYSLAPAFIRIYKPSGTQVVLLSPGQAVYVAGYEVSFDPKLISLTSRDRVPKEYWDLEDNQD